MSWLGFVLPPILKYSSAAAAALRSSCVDRWQERCDCTEKPHAAPSTVVAGEGARRGSGAVYVAVQADPKLNTVWQMLLYQPCAVQTAARS